MPCDERPYDPYTGHYYLLQCSHKKTVHIALTMTALHDLEVKAIEVLNADAIVSNIENIWTKLGPEFVDDAGKSIIFVRALYGLKSDSASFRAHLAQCMQE